ncbi:MAG: hypothetical protein ACI9RZ_002248 [Sphingobacteriales bacterium]
MHLQRLKGPKIRQKKSLIPTCSPLSKLGLFFFSKSRQP